MYCSSEDSILKQIPMEVSSLMQDYSSSAVISVEYQRTYVLSNLS